MPLTDTTIRNAKPGFAGKEKRLSLGVYPDVSLKDARDRRDASRKLCWPMESTPAKTVRR